MGLMLKGKHEMITPYATIEPKWLMFDVKQREYVIIEGAPLEVVKEYEEYIKQKKEMKEQGYR